MQSVNQIKVIIFRVVGVIFLTLLVVWGYDNSTLNESEVQ